MQLFVYDIDGLMRSLLCWQWKVRAVDNCIHLGASVQDGSRPGWPPIHRPRFADLPLSSATLLQRRLLFPRRRHTSHNVHDALVAPRAGPTASHAHRTRGTPDASAMRWMLFILDRPARAGTKGLCYDLKRRHRRPLSCFIFFVSSSRLVAAQSFFICFGPSIRHTHCPLITARHCFVLCLEAYLRVSGSGLETGPRAMPYGCALSFSYIRRVCRRLPS
jgi:hypothetical protein